MLRVGLTGGIGSGKSAVAALLARHGAYVVDSDALAREVVAPGTPGLAAIAEAFGPVVLAADGSLDRGALAGIVFENPADRAVLNAIVHPLVAAATAERVGAAPEGAVVVNDVPLLVETGMAPLFDVVVVVEAPVETRLARLAARGLPEPEARARIAAQATDEERRAVATYVVDNSGTLDDLQRSVDALWTALNGPDARATTP